MLQFLLLAGTAATAVKGLDFTLAGFERVTGVPLHTGCKAMINDALDQTRELVVAGGDLLVEGVGESVAGFLDPFHLVTDDPADQRDKALSQKKREAKKRKKAEAAARAAQAQAAEAGDRAAQLEQQAAAAEARATTAEAAAAAALKTQKAKAARGFVGLSRNLVNRSQAAAPQNPDQALAIAQQAMAMALAAMKPPTDAREALRGDDDDRTKQLKTDTINALNRDGDGADLDSLADRLTSADPDVANRAQEEYMDQAELMGAAGHDHKKGAACSCNGSCGACSTKASIANVYDWKTPEIAGRDTPQGSGFAWSSSPSSGSRARARLPASRPIVDELALSRSLTYSPASCRTGSCGVPQR